MPNVDMKLYNDRKVYQDNVSSGRVPQVLPWVLRVHDVMVKKLSRRCWLMSGTLSVVMGTRDILCKCRKVKKISRKDVK